MPQECYSYTHCNIFLYMSDIAEGNLLHNHPLSQAQSSLTFDSDLRHSLNDAKAAHGHAGVVR